MNYRLLSPALAEIDQAIQHYESKLPGLGSKFLDDVEATIARILLFPETWGRLSEDYRHCNLSYFPYTFIYTQISREDLIIVSVFHQSREPFSWKQNM